MSFYRVDSFHISVGAGDAAIHILSIGDGTSSNKRKVVKAIMIDGGQFTNPKKFTTMNDTIADIEKDYECQATDNQNKTYLKFDAFVITHYDADHCNGVIAFLKADIKAQVGKLTDAEAIKKVKLKRAYYKDDREPLSYFFAPHFKILQSGDDVGGGIKNVDGNLTSNADETQLNIIVNDPKAAENVLRMRVQTKELLGRNFFNGDEDNHTDRRQGSWAAQDIVSLTALLGKNKATLPNLAVAQIPGMYCIGVNQETLGAAPTTLETPTNKSSICAVIAWSDGRCSHYFAGDADFKLELRLLEWMKVDKSTRDIRVTSMKLSHHGAYPGSNPMKMYKNLNPDNIVVSAGGGNYGHPSTWKPHASDNPD
jgi:hypothetical protein